MLPGPPCTLGPPPCSCKQTPPHASQPAILPSPSPLKYPAPCSGSSSPSPFKTLHTTAQDQAHHHHPLKPAPPPPTAPKTHHSLPRLTPGTWATSHTSHTTTTGGAPQGSTTSPLASLSYTAPPQAGTGTPLLTSLLHQPPHSSRAGGGGRGVEAASSPGAACCAAQQQQHGHLGGGGGGLGDREAAVGEHVRKHGQVRGRGRDVWEKRGGGRGCRGACWKRHGAVAEWLLMGAVSQSAA